jgi:archaellum component FlaC
LTFAETALDQELVQYLDNRFQSVDRQFQSVDRQFQSIDSRFQSIENRFQRVDEQFQELHGEMNEGLEEVKRHSGVLVEGLRHEVQLLAEGLAMHIQVQHVQEREYHDQQHRETRALIRSLYEELRPGR